LAALADGSLGPEQAGALADEVQRSPVLQAMLAEQQRALELLRTTDTVAAPADLRARVQDLTAGSGRSPAAGRRPARPRLVLLTSFAVAAIAVVLAIVLPGGAATPTTVQAATLARRPATLPAPAENAVHGYLLRATAAGVAFPYWEDHFGWTAAGARSDTLSGRKVTTVFYRSPRGRRLAYSIVAGSPLSNPASARGLVKQGVRLHVMRRQGRTIVTWLRSGHSCVLSAVRVSATELERLAGWRAHGAIHY
jgi:hypothetical protein